VEFRFTNGTTLPGHKTILSCASPMFRAIFEGKMESRAVAQNNDVRPVQNRHASPRATTIVQLFDSLGISRDNAEAFEREEVDLNVLKDLSDEELAALLPKLGPRKKLIAYLRGGAAPAADPLGPPAYDGNVDEQKRDAAVEQQVGPPAYEEPQPPAVVVHHEEPADYSVHKPVISPFPGVASVHQDRTQTVITLTNDVLPDLFQRVLEFLYTGMVTLRDKKDRVQETMSIARLFVCEEMVTIGQNVLDNDPDLNPSLGTWLNDQSGAKAMELYLNKVLFSDVTLRAQDSPAPIPCHKALIMCRSTVVTTLVLEAKQSAVLVENTSHDTLYALLEYLYTGHCRLEDNSVLNILELAARWQMNHLVTLCELFASKLIERRTRDDIIKADMDIIGMLHTAQQCGATQLTNFCLHFLSTNYQVIKQRPDFVNLTGANLRHVEEHQWPPVSYLKELEAYGRKVGNKDAGKCLLM